MGCSNEFMNKPLQDQNILTGDITSRGIDDVVKPGVKPLEEQDKLLEFADKYFDKTSGYLRDIPFNLSSVTGQYIFMKGAGDPHWTPPHVTTSEAMGYGMRLAAYSYYVADILDNETAKTKYENICKNLWKAMKSFPSVENGNLIAWVIPADFNPATLSGRNNNIDDDDGDDEDADGNPLHYSVAAATDGDMDIALGLLLMETLWSGQGYQTDALKIINALITTVQTQTIGTKTYTYLPIGDWAVDWAMGNVVRPSDWFFHHIRVFKEYSTGANKDTWDDILNTYTDFLVNNPFDADSGLYPDFFVFDFNTEDGDDASEQIELFDRDSWYGKMMGEDVETEKYDFNACRLPWRIMEDVIFTKDRDLIMAASRIFNIAFNGGPITDTGITYELDGSGFIAGYHPAFGAPFSTTITGETLRVLTSDTVSSSAKGSCMVVLGIMKNKRVFDILNTGFIGYDDKNTADPDDDTEGYFADSISLFSQLITSGGMFAPVATSARTSFSFAVWQPNTFYTDGIIVLHNGQYWMNTSDHTSLAASAPGTPGVLVWNEFTYITPPQSYDSWELGTFYPIGAIVEYNGLNWINTFLHTAHAPNWYPGAPGIWFWEQY